MSVARGWKVLAACSTAAFLVMLDVTIVNIAFPDLVADFPESTPARLTWVLSGYNVVFAACLLASGRLADRFGRRRLLFVGLATFTGGSLLCAISPTVELLVVARCVQAVGGAMLMPASLALVLPEFPPERRSAAIGIWGAVGGIAAATGPSLGSLLVEVAGWRMVFLVNVPVALVAWLVGRRLLAESRDPDASGVPDLLGALLGSLAIGLIVFAIVQGGEWGYREPAVLAAVLGATVLVPAFLARSARHPQPILDLTLFRFRFFSVANAATFVFSMGFFAMLLVNVLFLTEVWGYAVLGAGVALTPGPLTAAAVAGPAGRMADRIGHRWVVVPGALLMAAGMASLVLRAGGTADYWGVFLPANILTGAGVGLSISTLSSAATAFLPPARFAMGSAFSTTCRQVGAALGIAVAVSLLTSVDDPLAGFGRAWTFQVVCALAAGALMVTLYRRPIGLGRPVPAVEGPVPEGVPLPEGPPAPTAPGREAASSPPAVAATGTGTGLEP